MLFLGCVNNLSKRELNQYNKRKDEFKICTGIKCNSRATFEKCLVCNSANSEKCVIEPNSQPSIVCENYVNECFTLISSKNILRGCLNDANVTFQAQCRNDLSKCETCPTTDGIGCNNSPFELETCIDCDSNIDGDCDLHPEKFKDKICNRIQPPDQSGCYLKKVINQRKKKIQIHLEKNRHWKQRIIEFMNILGE